MTNKYIKQDQELNLDPLIVTPAHIHCATRANDVMRGKMERYKTTLIVI